MTISQAMTTDQASGPTVAGVPMPGDAAAQTPLVETHNLIKIFP